MSPWTLARFAQFCAFRAFERNFSAVGGASATARNIIRNGVAERSCDVRERTAASPRKFPRAVFSRVFFRIAVFRRDFSVAAARRRRAARRRPRTQRRENIFAKLLTSQKHVISFRPKQPHTCGRE
jgi:hypothetical protein